VAGHRLKHELDLPLVSTFHTLARVKAETGDPEPQRRVEAETAVIGCSDAILANCPAEAAQLQRLYGADPSRIEIVPPGVVHAFFSPGDRAGARAALDHLGPLDGPVLLFVGRIQPLKGLDVAVRALAELGDPTAVLVVVGGASGAGGRHEVERIEKLAASLGVSDRVRFTAPQPHHMLSTFYRAADVVLVPSRSESFGLVALEAAACGTPVVAAAVGGLRTLVDHGRTGFLVEGRDPAVYTAYAEQILANPALADELSAQAARRARDFTWSTAAGRLRRIYADLTARSPVSCEA
jgi:D-inositol-3-phosphate glycosyltransferase